MDGWVDGTDTALVGGRLKARRMRDRSRENSGGGGHRWMGPDRLGFDLIFISEEFRLGANSSLRSKSDGQEK